VFTSLHHHTGGNDLQEVSVALDRQGCLWGGSGAVASQSGRVAAQAFLPAGDRSDPYLKPQFSTPWKQPLALEQISKSGRDKWNIFRSHLNEHIGTHLDAPLHCTELDSADRIPVEQLVGPLAIVGA
jgi:hypothetical protein